MGGIKKCAVVTVRAFAEKLMAVDMDIQRG